MKKSLQSLSLSQNLLVLVFFVPFIKGNNRFIENVTTFLTGVTLSNYKYIRKSYIGVEESAQFKRIDSISVVSKTFNHEGILFLKENPSLLIPKRR